MAYQKLQVSTALELVPSDYINIPNPSDATISSQTTGTSLGGLSDSSKDFFALGVEIGDIVYANSSVSFPDVYDVVAVVSAIPFSTTLTLDDGSPFGGSVSTGAGINYKIYKNSSNGCVLYVGVSGDMKVETAGGSVVTVKAAPNGYHPIQVKKVLETGTTATNIVALW